MVGARMPPRSMGWKGTRRTSYYCITAVFRQPGRPMCTQHFESVSYDAARAKLLPTPRGLCNIGQWLYFCVSDHRTATLLVDCKLGRRIRNQLLLL